MTLLKQTDKSSYSLDNFEGPLHFLLHLVQKSEISISEISLRSLVAQYIERIDAHSNLDNGAEFVGTTASLLWLKSKMLLPHECNDEEIEETESPFAILPKLLEYCHFKEIAADLGERELKAQTFYRRGNDPSYTPSKKLLGIEKISLDQLGALFEEVLKKSRPQKGLIQEEEWRVSEKMDEMRSRLASGQAIPFHEVFLRSKSREELIVIFLAVLEMLKLEEIAITENLYFRPLIVT